MRLFLLLLLRILSCTPKICYSCYGESLNSSCVQNPRSADWTDCEDGECQVWKLYSQSDVNNIYMFERSCSGICRQGCVEIADMGHRFTSCSTCCHSNFCNIGSDCSSLTHFLIVPIYVVLIVLLC